jgi:Flp pilus assembly protein TadG
MRLSRTQPCGAQALVEFALVLPLIVILSLGTLQLVLYAHARDVVTSSVQEGARLAAEDGRALDEGYARAQALMDAGLGQSVDAVQIDGTSAPDLVDVRIDAQLRPILPLVLVASLPLHAEAWVTRERFRPGGG